MQVQHRNVTAEDNVVIKFDLGFQLCCLLSIIKEKKKPPKVRKQKYRGMAAFYLHVLQMCQIVKFDVNLLKDREVTLPPGFPLWLFE